MLNQTLEATGRTALVTGGSQGIGAAIVRALHRSGAHVVIAARRIEPCQALAEQLGDRAQPLALDVTDQERVNQLQDELGRVDWVINNAGAAESAPLVGSDDGLFHRMMDLNFHGARRLAGCFLPAMLKRDYGRIVSIASSAGLYGYPYVAAYCASKFALVGYTRAASLELKDKGVGFSAVCPHYVDTPLLAESIDRLVSKTGKSPEQARAFFANENPSGRLVLPEDVASCVLGLCLGEGRGIVELDGGAAVPEAS